VTFGVKEIRNENSLDCEEGEFGNWCERVRDAVKEAVYRKEGVGCKEKACVEG